MQWNPNWGRGVREEPPRWPFDHGRGVGAGGRAPDRWTEPYGTESYPAATVLDDFDGTIGNDEATLRVLARYSVLRLVMLTAAGMLRGVKLRNEQRVATDHVLLLPPHAGERVALLNVIGRCVEEPDAGAADALIAAAAAAQLDQHASGEFALLRAAFHIAVRRRHWAAAAHAASGIARLARLDEAHRSARLWARRAAVLERRFRRGA